MDALIAAPAPVAPLGGHQLLVFLLQLGVLLLAAVLLGRLATRLGTVAVVGELCAGVLLGPSVLGHLSPPSERWLLPADAAQLHLLDAVGQVGVLLLVGVTGMHLELGLARRRSRAAVCVSAGGLVLPLALGVGTGMLLPASLLAGGGRTVFALFLGTALCVSAIPVIAKTLFEMRLLHRDVGQLIMTAAVIDDTVGWLLLSVVAATAGTGLRAGRVVFSLLSVLTVLAVAAVVGRPLVRWAMHAATRSGPGSTVPVAVVVLLLCSAGTQALGLEAILGALVAGLLIGSSGRVDLDRLVPLREFGLAVLAPVFFATAGLRMDLGALRRPVVAGAAAAVVLVAVVGKVVGAYLGGRAGRLDRWTALALGAGMNARGVVGVVIAMAGLRLGVLTVEMYTVVVLAAIVTTVLTPPSLRWAVQRIDATPEERAREDVFTGYRARSDRT